MKCMDCGRTVGNWPVWLGITSIEVRCARCSGNGSNVINSPNTSAMVPPIEPSQNHPKAVKAA